MVEEWRTLSNGQVTVRIYPGGVAGDDTDVVRKMRLGTLNAGLLTSTGLEDVDRGVLALQIPLAYASYAELDCALEKLGPELERRLAAKGFILLAWTDGGFVRFFSKNPVRTPDDLKSAKLFSWAGDDQYVELWKKAGFNPIPLPATEISTALQTGLINALPTTPQAAVLLQWYKQAHCMTVLDWAVLLGGMVVNKSAWEKIPPALRPALQQSARQACQRLRDLSRESTPKDVEAMSKRGLTEVKLTPAEVDLWRRALEEAYPKIRGSFVPADAFDAALKVRDECRRQAATAGRR
jgi:TRAP-type C4-dicarboxylate transport system substrate-binding protein